MLIIYKFQIDLAIAKERARINNGLQLLSILSLQFLYLLHTHGQLLLPTPSQMQQNQS